MAKNKKICPLSFESKMTCWGEACRWWVHYGGSTQDCVLIIMAASLVRISFTLHPAEETTDGP